MLECGIIRIILNTAIWTIKTNTPPFVLRGGQGGYLKKEVKFF